MKLKPYYPELQKSICQTLELTDHLTKLTKNLSKEIKLTLEGKTPIHYFMIFALISLTSHMFLQ